MAGTAAPVIATLNTWKGEGPYRDRLALIEAQGRRLAPDILLLQECFEAPELGLDTAAAVARALGHNAAFAPARGKERRIGGKRAYSASGMAVLSRGEIAAAETVALPTDPRDGERIAQVATVVLDGRRFLVANVHLCYLDDRDDLRRDELEVLCGALPSPKDFDAAVMGGDFNAAWDSGAMAWLRHRSGFEVRDACAPEAGGRRFDTHGGFNDDRAPVRIDYLLQLSVPGTAPRWALARGRPAFDAPDAKTGLYPSDHIGVRAAIVPAGG